MPIEVGEKRIEMSLDGDDAVIKLSSWVNGLGWCGQKTLQVDAEMLDDLHRMIGVARVRMRSRRVENGEVVSGQKILAFPAS